jgi:hypothetical protein
MLIQERLESDVAKQGCIQDANPTEGSPYVNLSEN